MLPHDVLMLWQVIVAAFLAFYAMSAKYFVLLYGAIYKIGTMSNWTNVQLKLSIMMCGSNLNISLTASPIGYVHVALLSLLKKINIPIRQHPQVVMLL